MITQRDIDNLADIIWWIKGYRAGCNDDYSLCPFGNDHIESLRLSRIELSKMINDEKVKQ